MNAETRRGVSGAMLGGIRELDAGGWRLATWSAPVALQVAFGLWFLVGWPLLNWSPVNSNMFNYVTLSATITTAVLLATGALLLSGTSPRRRCFGLAIIASGVTVLASMLAFVLFVVLIFENL